VDHIPVVRAAARQSLYLARTGERRYGNPRRPHISPGKFHSRMPLAVLAPHAYTVGELTVEEKQ